MDANHASRYRRPMPAKKASSRSADASKDAPELRFEEAVEQLEAIIERIERGEVGLEESLEEYEKGVALVKRCRDILGRVEQRITELSKGLDEADAG